jgi:serine/threonine protein kinase
MASPTPEEIWLLRELVSTGQITSIQAKQVLEEWRDSASNEMTVSLVSLLVKRNFVTQEATKVLLSKSPLAISAKASSQENKFFEEEAFLTEKLFKGIEGFEYRKFLGTGIIGSSYLGEIDSTNAVVVKLLYPRLLENTEYINSIKKTLSLIDYGNHPHLLPNKYNETTDGQIYFTSKYIEDDSIGSLLKNIGRLEINSAIEIIKKTAEILKFFERIKSPHLGLHPENIFRSSDGTIYLKDFEWNRRFFTSTKDRVANGPGICYMSPEYIKGQKLDHTADIYSLGVLLYFFLTRRLIFQGNLEVQIAKKEKLDYIDITEVYREIPLYIGSLIKKMIEPNKDNRFLSYDSLISELDEILKKRRQSDISAKGSLPAQNASIFIKSDRKPSPISKSDEVKKETPIEVIPKRKNQIKTTILLLVLIGIIYGITQIPNSKNKDTTNSTTEKIPVVDLSNKKSLLSEIGNKTNIEPQKLIEFEDQTNEPLKVIQDKFKNELLQKKNTSGDEKKFSKKLNAIKVIQENLIEANKSAKDLVNKVVEVEIAQIDNERQVYWEEKKVKLKKVFTEKNEASTLALIDDISNETGNDEIIQNKIFQLRVETQKLDPEDKKNIALDEESKLLKENIEKKALPLQEGHDYDGLVKLLSSAIKNEKNINQKQIYIDQIEFYEHAEKVKSFAENNAVKPNTLLRSLYINLDGELDAVSSKGFHIKDSNNKIIPWNGISAKALSALVGRYEPTSLGESISLLIYASRAGNHIAMQKALKTIELKYGASMNTPLVKEMQESLKDLKVYLIEDAIKWQIGLIKTLKSRNTVKAKRDAETLIKELRDEYLSNPIYKRYEAEIIDITAALDQIK